MATVRVSDTNDWRETFLQFGRIIRGADNKIKKIIEVKDLAESQEEILEFNPAYYCFKADWLWQNLGKLTNDNAQGEYYLTDLIALACGQGQEIETIEIEPKEALGINTTTQFELIDKLVD